MTAEFEIFGFVNHAHAAAAQLRGCGNGRWFRRPRNKVSDARFRASLEAGARCFETLKHLLCIARWRRSSPITIAGRARMVDVSAKRRRKREAEASAFVVLKPEVLKALPKNPKGDPLEVARLAGIMAAKKTSDLIPMCHPLPLSHVDVTMRAVREWRRYYLKSYDHGRHRRGDGSAGRGQRRRADRVRYVQGAGQGHRDPRDRAGAEVRRQERRLRPLASKKS